MKFSYNWLQDYLPQKIAPQKMAELLTMRSFQVESVERRGDDFILDIDILPNRSHDCFSHLGVAREAAAASGSRLKIPPALRPGQTKEKIGRKIEVKEKELCPRYSAIILTDVKIGPSPKWLARRLEAGGQKLINNVVDIANFVMLELGQPLHAFDFSKLEGGKIIVRLAKKGEKIVALDGDKYGLDERILVIADGKKPVAIAGIKGGSGPGIDEKTKTIVLESANFDSQAIRSASRILNLRTDASIRFEQGVDPNLTEVALNRASLLIQECAGGRPAGGMLDFYPKKVLPKKIKLNLEKINKLAGFQFKPAQVAKILNSLGFKVYPQTKQSDGVGVKIAGWKSRELMVEVPTRRLDVEIPEDLTEEICRIYGYENIPSRLPEAVLVPFRKDDFLKLCDKVRAVMAALGFREVYNYSFLGEREINILEEPPENFVELENPVSRDFRYLRDSLLAGLLKNIARNSRNFKEAKIFEIGKVFWPQKNNVSERWRFSGAIWRKIPEKIPGELFYELKGAVDGLLDGLGVGERWYDNVGPTAEAPAKAVWNLGRSAEIKMDGGEFGLIGEIRAAALDKFDIPSAVVVFDFDLENLLKFVQEEREYTPISKYPAVVRDIAILVDRETRIDEVLDVVYSAGVKYIEDAELFDVYEGAELGQGRKNLAFHLIFQARDHTLTDGEVNGEVEKILKSLREELSAEIRK